MKEVKVCTECGSKPDFEEIEGRISVWCPICCSIHCTTAVGAGMDHAIDMWNESMEWLEECYIPVEENEEVQNG